MTIREATALVVLFEACDDLVLRQRVLQLVPELESFEPQAETVTVLVFGEDGR